MNIRTLIVRSLRFHWRSHLGVVLGAAIGSMALIGALVVGDSVRGTLRHQALQRLGPYETILAPLDRFFTQSLAERLKVPGYDAVPVLALPATAARQDGQARANQVQVIAVDGRFGLGTEGQAIPAIGADEVVLNQALAEQLQASVDDTIILRIRKPSALSRDVPITPQSDTSIALRVKVQAIAGADELGNFSLRANQVPPFNAFVPLDMLAQKTGRPGRANRLLLRPAGMGAGASARATSTPDLPATANQHLASALQLADLELDLHPLTNQPVIELQSTRIFISDPVANAVRAVYPQAQGVLTYLANLLQAGTNQTPYSMVTAAGPPWTPVDLGEQEILVSQWLANDLRVQPGDQLSLTYFLPESAARLAEATNRFTVRGVVPLKLPWADRTLMPEFPGLAKAETTHDWDAGFPLVHTIRTKDEAWWKERRGTPKAFISPAEGQKLWASRFGALTALRWPVPDHMEANQFQPAVAQKILAAINPAAVGLRFEPARQSALQAAAQSQDFGGLFIGFSFFLIVAALILMALLFQFGLEQRITEIGTFLALGFRARQVRRLFLGEGVALAAVGGLIGLVAGLGYAWAMLRGLTTIWRDAVSTSALGFHVTPLTLVIGAVAAVAVSTFTIWLALRKQARQPVRELLAGEITDPGSPNREVAANSSGIKKVFRRLTNATTIGWASLLCALALLGSALAAGETSNAETFFSAGSLLLIAGIAFTARWLRRLAVGGLDAAGASSSAKGRAPTRSTPFGLRELTIRALARRRSRSLAVASLLACGSFLIASIGAFRLDANQNATQRSSGTGGFALLGESALPVIRDLNEASGRDYYALDESVMNGVRVVPLRVRDGDEASCLNLNRAQRPRLLGVNPESLAERRAFTFAKVAKGLSADDGWRLLKSSRPAPSAEANAAAMEVPAIGDLNAILWAMGKQVGDTIDYVDERGHPFKVRLVGAVANSILQGSLLIDEAEFVRRFPGESGFRSFLIDAPTNRLAAVSAALSRALRDVGLELTPATRRLAQFNAVQNTYLNTFQILGGLGLLLGTVGLGVVVLRNVLERRGELALLLAVGYRRRSLRQLVLGEHGGLLALGLGIGLVAAVVGILPQLLAPGAQISYASLGLTLLAVLASGLVWTWLATLLALRGNLLEALRNE